MTEDLQEVRTALQKRFGNNEKEIEQFIVTSGEKGHDEPTEGQLDWAHRGG